MSDIFKKKWKVDNISDKVNNKLFNFYNNLFKSDTEISKHGIAQFLDSVKIPRLSGEWFVEWDISIFMVYTLFILKPNLVKVFGIHSSFVLQDN